MGHIVYKCRRCGCNFQVLELDAEHANTVLCYHSNVGTIQSELSAFSNTGVSPRTIHHCEDGSGLADFVGWDKD